MAKYSTLCLGTRQDAASWNKGCANLGFTEGVSVRKATPSAEEIASVFATSAAWVYFGGHFVGDELYNELSTVGLTFENDKVRVRTAAGTQEIAKGSDAFKLGAVKVVLWGGCSVCSSDGTVQTMRTLFGNHLLLGFAGSTGWAMVDALLGNGFIKTKHFFGNVGSKLDDMDHVANAWMEAGLYGYGGGAYEGKVRAIKPDGQELKIVNKAIVDGRKFK